MPFHAAGGGDKKKSDPGPKPVEETDVAVLHQVRMLIRYFKNVVCPCHPKVSIPPRAVLTPVKMITIPAKIKTTRKATALVFNMIGFLNSVLAS